MSYKACDFHLIDLVSQGAAVQRKLSGMTEEQKIDWLRDRGEVREIDMPKEIRDGRMHYWFTSRVNLQCSFFLDGDAFVFVGDHTLFRVND